MPKKSSQLILSLLAAILLASCAPGDTETRQLNFEVELNLITSIDEFPELNPPWVISPGSVVASENGFIFTDAQLMRVHVLGRDGSLETAFGREGRGPGELLGVNFAYMIGPEISIPDINNGRTTVFDHSGNFIRHVRHESHHPVVTGQVHHWEGNRYLTVAYAMHAGNCLFYELNEKSEIGDACFGDYETLEYADIELLKHIARNGGAGDIHFISPNRFIFAPAFYYGSNYVYAWDGETWVQESVINGFSYHEEAAIPANELKSEPGYFSIQFEGSDPMTARILSRSYGYYPVDGYLLHITTQIVENEEITVIELFTEDGEFLSHNSQDFATGQQGRFVMSVLGNHFAVATALDLEIYEISVSLER